MIYEEHFPAFITITCYNWERLLARSQEKEIIIESLRFLVGKNRIKVHAFVLMDNHFHLIGRVPPAVVGVLHQQTTIPS